MEVRDQLILKFASNFKQVIRRSRADFTTLFEGYIPLNELKVLRVLDENSDLTVSQIADLLCVSNSHITTVSEKLIKKGYLTRKRCEHDRRMVFLSITEEGKDLKLKMDKITMKYFKDRLIGLTDEEIETINRLFLKILS